MLLLEGQLIPSLSLPLSYLPPSVSCLNPPSLPLIPSLSPSFPLSLLPPPSPPLSFCSSSLTSPTGLFSFSFSSHLTDGVKHTLMMALFMAPFCETRFCWQITSCVNVTHTTHAHTQTHTLTVTRGGGGRSQRLSPQAAQKSVRLWQEGGLFCL